VAIYRDWIEKIFIGIRVYIIKDIKNEWISGTNYLTNLGPKE